MKADRFPPLLIPVSVVTGAIFTIVCAAVLIANHGHFAFSFDDPYIHLAMAEEITRGHYGINWSDSAAAASSILYPFLLAPLIALGLGQYAALVLNLAGLGAIAYVVSGLLHDTRLPLAEMPRLPLAIGAAVLSSGVIVLALSGLEHSLQVADALACLWGLMRFLRTHRASGWWLAALIAAPLIRYEGMAILLAGVIVLVVNRAWWPALVALVAIYIARDPDSKVLGLVSNAWAGFGAAFGPLILLSAVRGRSLRILRRQSAPICRTRAGCFCLSALLLPVRLLWPRQRAAMRHRNGPRGLSLVSL